MFQERLPITVPTPPEVPEEPSYGQVPTVKSGTVFSQATLQPNVEAHCSSNQQKNHSVKTLPLKTALSRITLQKSTVVLLHGMKVQKTDLWKTSPSQTIPLSVTVVQSTGTDTTVQSKIPDSATTGQPVKIMNIILL